MDLPGRISNFFDLAAAGTVVYLPSLSATNCCVMCNKGVIHIVTAMIYPMPELCKNTLQRAAQDEQNGKVWLLVLILDSFGRVV